MILSFKSEWWSLPPTIVVTTLSLGHPMRIVAEDSYLTNKNCFHAISHLHCIVGGVIFCALTFQAANAKMQMRYFVL